MSEEKSRAAYFRRRRETMGQFMAMVNKETLAALDGKLRGKGISRAAWLREKIRQELEEGS